MYKIRTMFNGAENGAYTTCQDDPRITKIGKWLRKTKLDELPNFYNVFVGDMSVVGPRPDVPKNREINPELWEKILSINPGITDNASLRFFNGEYKIPNDGSADNYYRCVILPQKQEMCLEYLDNQSFMTDLTIIVKTAKKMLI